MSNPSWSNVLKTALKKSNQRITILGIGHELRSDDAAGVKMARVLKRSLANKPQILVIEGGSAPENHTAVIRRFAPDIVLLVDAAEMGQPPGFIKCLSWEQITGLSASTHTLPLHILAHYLHAELSCQVLLIGIQPETLTIGESLSLDVEKAVFQLTSFLTKFFQN